ncbi:MAG: hypothetical protein AAF570_25695 [Bacteroidota bacterium]
MKNHFILLCFLLICFSETSYAQESSTGLLWSIKTNLFQYAFGELNLSVERQNGQNGWEVKATGFMSRPWLFSQFATNFSVYGAGVKGHVMYRRYTQDGVLFISGGLAYKFWGYKRQEFFYYRGSYGCSIEDRIAHLPALKVLWGVKAKLGKGRVLMEPYMGAALRYRWGRTAHHATGTIQQHCTEFHDPPREVQNKGFFLPGAYLGINFGLNLGSRE